MIKDSYNLFRLSYNEQTLKMERGAGTYITDASITDTSFAGDKSSSRLKPPAGKAKVEN
jgi:hypothetical protein